MLRQLFGARLDEEVESTQTDNTSENSGDTGVNNQTTVNDNSVPDGTNGDNSENTPVASENTDNSNNKNNDTQVNGGDNMPIFEDGWFNSENGEVDESKIKNPEALEAIRAITNKYNQEREQRVISDSLTEELKNYSLNVSDATLKKVLDLSNVKIGKDGKPVGIKEAIEAVKTAEPGFFKDKEKESNPLNEGFNPVDKKTALSEDEIINMAYGQENQE